MSVTAERHGDRIFVRSPWYPRAAQDAKSVPGASWRKKDGVWSYPLDLPICYALRRVYGSQLTIGPELEAWARATKKFQERMRRIGRQKNARLRVVPEISPRLAKAMKNRKYQRSGARFAAVGRSVCFADQPSLGKTSMALAGLMEGEVWNGQHLVIAPKTSLATTWKRQIETWSSAEVFPIPDARPETRRRVIEEFLNSDAKAKFLCVNPAMVMTKMGKWCPKCQQWEEKDILFPPDHYRYAHSLNRTIKECKYPELFSFKWNSITLDECHETLSTYRPANVTQVAEGLFRLKTVPNGMRIAMTGTPLRGKEVHLWGIKSWLGRAAGGYWPWVMANFETRDGHFGKSIERLDPDRYEEFYSDIDSFILRRTKQEVRPEVPPKDIQPVWVEMTPKHRQQYEQFVAEGEAHISGGTLDSFGVLSELTRLKQLSFGVWKKVNGNLVPTEDSAVLEWLIQALADRGVTGKKATDFLPEEGVGHKYVIASQFTEVIDIVETALNRRKIHTLKITGSVTGRKRVEAQRSFQESYEGPRVMLLNTYTGGVSLELDAYCDEMFILDETWVADEQEQLEGRIDNRSGRIANRTFHYIRVEDTVVEEIAKSNITQDEMQKDLLDRRRGVEVAMRLLRKQ